MLAVAHSGMRVAQRHAFVGTHLGRMVGARATSSSGSSKSSSESETASPAAASARDTAEEDRRHGVQAFLHRFVVAMEVTISKIFPAGFGWQGASVLAEGIGLQASDVSFALTTGIGDGLGVFLGHALYMSGKRYIFPKDVNMTEQLQTGALLAAAATCSGTAWQPTVNMFEVHGFEYPGMFFGTAVFCGAAFFGGLRVFRAVLPSFGLTHIAPPAYDNLKVDAQLSVAIGGASGCFVGTDMAYHGGVGNFLGPYVGITDDMGALEGMVRAGKSTAIGFATIQTMENIAWPRSKNWTD